VLETSGRTRGCFTVVFSQTQLPRFLGAAVATRQLPVAARLQNNPPAGAHEWRKNRPAPVFVCLPVEEICVAVVPNWSRLDTTHFAELRRMFKSSVRYCRLVPDDRPDLPTTSKVIICRSLRSCSTFSCVRPVKGRSARSQFSTEVSYSKFCVLHTKCSLQAVFSA